MKKPYWVGKIERYDPNNYNRDWKEQRLIVLNRDKFKCKWCKSKLKLVLQKLGVREKRTSKDRVYLGIKFKNIE